MGRHVDILFSIVTIIIIKYIFLICTGYVVAFNAGKKDFFFTSSKYVMKCVNKYTILGRHEWFTKRKGASLAVQ